MRISIAGIGYVGLSLAIALGEKHEVTLIDINAEKVDKVNSGVSPIENEGIKEYLKDNAYGIKATVDPEAAYHNAEMVIIAVPTPYDEGKKGLDTSMVEDVIKEALSHGTKPLILIKSTLPIGTSEALRNKYVHDFIYFSPEFLREKTCLYDAKHPSRIIVGHNGSEKDSLVASKIADVLKDAVTNKETPILLMRNDEAEAVKLFSNAYLAMRVCFFNELDALVASKGLNTSNVIKGVSLDPRIGDYYNHPSSGFGGSCLPKDSRELEGECDDSYHLLKSINKSNEERRKRGLSKKKD